MRLGRLGELLGFTDSTATIKVNQRAYSENPVEINSWRAQIRTGKLQHGKPPPEHRYSRKEERRNLKPPNNNNAAAHWNTVQLTDSFSSFQ